MRVPPEEGAWLETADGTRHLIKGSCSVGWRRAASKNGLVRSVSAGNAGYICFRYAN
jgi:hypothetical protein